MTPPRRHSNDRDRLTRELAGVHITTAQYNRILRARPPPHTAAHIRRIKLALVARAREIKTLLRKGTK